MKMRNLLIGTRLGLGFGLVLVLLVMLALVSLSRLAAIHDSLDKIINENNVAIKRLNDMRQAVMVAAVSVRNLSLMTNPDEVAVEAKLIETANAAYKQNAAAIEKMITRDAGKALLAKIVEAQAATTPGIEKAIAMALRQGDVIPVLGSVVVPNQRKWLEAMDAMIVYQDHLAKETSEDAGTTYAHARMLTLVLSGAALLLGALIAWCVTRSITAPLQGAAKLARRVADGDLTTRVEVRSTDETGQLLQALKDMNESLARIVSEVRGGTDAITHASCEIASGNMHLSARTEDQANSLQTTASSMEELTSTVKHNADNAAQANRLAASASEVAIKGGAVVSQVIDTMGSINASAKKIVDIISVIDGIAFQTNILALNAAVEAARAGEQGRGFAVVAAEVRTLAQRSASAAKEIKELIGDSVQKVDAGAKLVDQAGSTMNEIVESVRKVTEIIGEIATASSEQTSGIEQINQSVMQIDDATQQNAALVEQAAAAAAAMQERAYNLSQVVHVFKLEDSEPAFVQPAPQARVIATDSKARLSSSPKAALDGIRPELPHH